MKNLKKYILGLLVCTSIIGCDTLEPVDENRLDFEFVSSDPDSAEGILLNAYTGIANQFSFSDVATDDAVSNILDNDFKRMALGELNAQFNPAASWGSFQRVFWANRFLQIIDADEIVWGTAEELEEGEEDVTNQLFRDRLKGEALALRGLHHYYALQAHAGESASGELLGVPYFTEFIEPDGNFNVPRLSFEATVQAIMNDYDEAIELLPTDYTNNEALFDDKYDGVNVDIYKRVNGAQNNLRISGRIVRALKARLALFAASPSFLDDQAYYTIAAENAAAILNTIGGVSGLVPGGDEFYTSDLDETISREFIWRASIGGPTSNFEERMFPPTLNGSGEVNPTHNLVMAFPMLDGRPATEENDFDPQNPYNNRDPRLEKYVIFNGASYQGQTINTGVGAGFNRLDSIPELSTTTGYYLKKLLRPDVTINNDGSASGKIHFNVYFRYTELFLILAEAANEIGGPDLAIEGISARDVIAAIRERAGITQPDSYLATITTQDDMRELIRNERRIELSFEGHRIWDIRRWGLPLNESAKGYFFNGNNYVELPSVEVRNYPSFATYLPIPNAETLRFPALIQNNGW